MVLCGITKEKKKKKTILLLILSSSKKSKCITWSSEILMFSMRNPKLPGLA